MKINPAIVKFYGTVSVPNGGLAILDNDNKLLAYRKPNSTEWDWIRKDCQKN